MSLTDVIARGEVLRYGSSAVFMHRTLRDAGGATRAVATATAVPRPFPGNIVIPAKRAGPSVTGTAGSSSLWVRMAAAWRPGGQRVSAPHATRRR